MSGLLVTGGAGFIGSNFARRWKRRFPHDQLVVLDALTYAGNRENLSDAGDLTFVKGDITDSPLVAQILSDTSINFIVHFAAETHVDRSIEDSDAFIRTNVQGTQILLDTARKAWRGRSDVRFHHVSTDEVFGSLDVDSKAFNESTPYAPNSPYAASKAAADHLVRAAAHTHGLPITISNCSNNYGPRQFPEKLIPLMLKNALVGAALPVYGDGANIRDWLFVDDHNAALEAILLRGKVGETYCIGGDCEMTNNDLVAALCDAIDRRFRSSSDLAVRFPACPAAKGRSCSELITYVADRLGHDRRYAIDFTKISNELGWRPQTGLSEGLAVTLDWYLA